MGLPVTDRGGPPGGGGMGRPDALVGAWAGAEGGAAGGALGGRRRRGLGTRAAQEPGRPPGWPQPAPPEQAWVVPEPEPEPERAGAGDGPGDGARAAGAAGAGARGGAVGTGPAGRAGAGAGCSEAGRLVTSRAPVRLTGAVDGAPGAGAEGSSPIVGAGSGPPGGAGSAAVEGSGATFFAAAFLVAAAFLAGGAGSSGCTGRRRPSRSAFRRARSACASSMDDEWLLTPIPRDRQRSSASLLVSPSSWASS